MPSQQLEELAQYIRATLPQPRTILDLQIKDPPGVVNFNWQGRDFMVKPPYEVLEVKGEKLFITGASTLMQLVLMKKNRNEKVVEAVLGTLAQAEDLIGNPLNREKGLALLGSVKQTLQKLIGTTSRR